MSMSERLDTPEIRRLRLAVAEFLLGRSREEGDAFSEYVLDLIDVEAGAVTVEVLDLIEKSRNRMEREIELKETGMAIVDFVKSEPSLEGIAWDEERQEYVYTRTQEQVPWQAAWLALGKGDVTEVSASRWNKFTTRWESCKLWVDDAFLHGELAGLAGEELRPPMAYETNGILTEAYKAGYRRSRRWVEHPVKRLEN